jgi:undecaprenyl-diphosphatase
MQLFNILDSWLFYLINKGLENPLFDSLMPFITANQSWYLVYFFLILWLLFNKDKRLRYGLIVLIVTIVFVDQMNSSFLKELFGRLRPCHTLSDIRLLVPCGGGKSFPSSHAANNFAAATVLSFFIKKYRYVYFATAFLVSFSRIYVGVHYPFDVLAGAVFGVATGLLFVWIFIKLEKTFSIET